MKKTSNQNGGKVLLWIMILSLVLFCVAFSFDIRWAKLASGVAAPSSFFFLVIYCHVYSRITVKAQALPQMTGIIGIIATVVIFFASYLLKSHGEPWDQFFWLGITTIVATMALTFMIYVTTEPEDLGD